ncbi:conjugative transposon protein TraK [Pedobacter sp. AW1-32]|uniref:conjugative transposon protein TraK n=1 Tax=Pedobacter sp. AW1-32 TaxID=3383026 RepID=UPI003FEDEF8A
MLIANIESKVRLAGRLSVMSFVLSFSLCALSGIIAYLQVKESTKNIYVLDQESLPLLAHKSSGLDNRLAEYKAHVVQFHSLFFSMVPDEKFIESQMSRAMYLIDESGVREYNNLKESGFFSSLLSSSAVISVQVDSVQVNPENGYFRYFASQRIDRRSRLIIRSLITEGYLKDLGTRSENNPHALLITRWKTLENKDLSLSERNPL